MPRTLRNWSGIITLTALTAATLALTACTPRTNAQDDHVPDTRQRSVNAPLCTKKGVNIGDPCSEGVHTPRAADSVMWRFYPSKGDKTTAIVMEECPKTGAKPPCMAVPRHDDRTLAGDPVAILLDI